MREHWIKADKLASTNSYVSDLLKHRVLDEGTVVVILPDGGERT